MKRQLSLIAVPTLLFLVAVSCASGPSDDAIARDLRPSTTTTTVPLPDNLALIRITNASFQPAVLNLDPTTVPLVRWVNEDDVDYEIVGRSQAFASPAIPPGGVWEFDFSTLEPGVYRYFITRGAQTIPGLVDTRPEQ